MVILVSGFSFKRVAYILTLKANKSKGNTVLTTIFEEREEGKKRKEGRKEGRRKEGRKEGWTTPAHRRVNFKCKKYVKTKS